MQCRKNLISTCASLLCGLSLSACASSRIADGLTRSGVEPSKAQCVGERLERDLTLAQLKELGRIANAARGPADRNRSGTSAIDLVRAAGQVHDLKVPLAVAKATANCGLLANAIGQTNNTTDINRETNQ